jgi:hypothetical protein
MGARALIMARLMRWNWKAVKSDLGCERGDMDMLVLEAQDVQKKDGSISRSVL